MEYKINEIFYSLQGEGLWVGTPMLFIRMAGCNYKCEFCDTDYSHKLTLSIEGILKYVRGVPTKDICITGGEPFLQDLNPLVSTLHKKVRSIYIETNGFLLSRIKDLGSIRPWIVCSPKEPIKEDDWDFVNEFKWLLGDGKDLWKDLIDKNLYHLVAWNFIQPVWDKDREKRIKNYKDAIKLVKENPKLRLSVQLHKFIGIK